MCSWTTFFILLLIDPSRYLSFMFFRTVHALNATCCSSQKNLWPSQSFHITTCQVQNIFSCSLLDNLLLSDCTEVVKDDVKHGRVSEPIVVIVWLSKRCRPQEASTGPLVTHSSITRVLSTVIMALSILYHENSCMQYLLSS